MKHIKYFTVGLIIGVLPSLTKATRIDIYDQGLFAPHTVAKRAALSYDSDKQQFIATLDGSTKTIKKHDIFGIPPSLSEEQLENFLKDGYFSLGKIGEDVSIRAFQRGNVKVRWNARLESHMGQWTFEPLSTHTAFLLESSGPLAALVSAATLCHLALPERHPYPFLYEQLKALLEELRTPEWRKAYVFFERSLLEELGYGLNLKACAVTGVTTNLIAVSPRTGRAVCKDVAMPYLDRLLSLPPFLSPEASLESPPSQDILEALSLIGHFLERHLLGRILPPARARLVKFIGKN